MKTVRVALAKEKIVEVCAVVPFLERFAGMILGRGRGIHSLATSLAIPVPHCELENI